MQFIGFYGIIIVMKRNKIELMRLSIELSKLSFVDKTRIVPKVGAVLTDANGNILSSAFRDKQHCECEIIQKAKAAGIPLKDTTLFVTMEPCTYRNIEELPCAVQIVDNGIKNVFIGMDDPNKRINGRGVSYLMQNGILVRHYPRELAQEIADINSDFIGKYL